MSLAPDIPVTKKRPALELLLGRIQANARAVVRSVRPAPPVAAAPAPEKIDAFDDRWSTPSKPPVVVAKPPPIVAPAPTSAPEKIDAFDDRWSSPPRPPLAVAKPEAAKPATKPIAAPSGDRVSRLNSLLTRIAKNRR